MEKKERLKELFGSMSDESESPPPSPPPGAWPPTIDPSRRYPVPRVRTQVQRGDGSQRSHTRRLEKLPPAPPKATRKERSQPTGTTAARKPPRKITTDAVVTANMTASDAVTTVPPTTSASGSSGSSSQARQLPRKRAPATKLINTAAPGRNTISKTAATSEPGSSGPARGGLTTAPQSIGATGHSSQAHQKPIFRSMDLVRPPRPEVPTVVGIERHSTTGGRIGQSLAQKPAKASEMPHITRAMTAIASAPPPAVPWDSVAAAGSSSTEIRTTAEGAAPSYTCRVPAASLTLPLSPFATAMSVALPPASPAYVISTVHIQLPDGEFIQVPTSAIWHNRKYRARSATGRWVLRFAPDGRITARCKNRHSNEGGVVA
ncbi:hypothetical protein PUN28_003592 [Cardiocondyla obscurior]|uniref:Uncharacterized protein n=1 Tax=Cardiocondyla obscurior TaxID=286306 RepID=A0AAW2GMA8_9HYME